MLRRRHLLQLAGACLGASVIPASHHLAAKPGGVRRLLIVTTEHGTVYDNWKMRVGGPADPTIKERSDWDHTLAGLEPDQMSPILKPLYPLRDKMLVLDGVSMASSMCDTPGDDHGGGRFHALTGANALIYGQDPAELDWEGMSVDVRIAERVAQEGRYRSLHFSDSGAEVDDGIYSRERGGTRIPYEASPGAIYQRLFADLDADEPGSAASRVRKRRAEILMAVKHDYTSAGAHASLADRFKLEQHADFMGKLAARVEGLEHLSCQTPSAPVYDELDKLSRNAAMADLIAASFVCDLARVITFDITAFTADMLGAPDKDLHEDFAHHTHPEAIAKMTLHGEKTAALVGGLVTKLDSIPEGEGTMLDHTLVVWTGELANGQHQVTPLPYVLFGGGANMVATGRYVHYASSHQLPMDISYRGQQLVGPAHNHLLVSLCHAMGQTDIDWVGQSHLADEMDVTGPLPGVLA
jgi:hypothetical protein